MDPPQPPPAGVDPAVAAQMRIMQHMADTMADMHAQMRQERQEMRREREDIRQEMRQEREEIRQEEGRNSNTNSNTSKHHCLHLHHQFHPETSTVSSWAIRHRRSPVLLIHYTLMIGWSLWRKCWLLPNALTGRRFYMLLVVWQVLLLIGGIHTLLPTMLLILSHGRNSLLSSKTAIFLLD
jgi:hypothetical protein